MVIIKILGGGGKLIYTYYNIIIVCSCIYMYDIHYKYSRVGRGGNCG